MPRYSVFLLFPSLLLAAGTTLADTSDQTAIDRVRDAFNAAVNAADTSALEAILDEHAVWMQPYQPAMIGRDAIIAAYAQRFRQTHPRIDLHPGEILVSGDLAILHGRFARTDAPDPAASDRPVAGHYMMALRRQQDGAWRIIRDIWNESDRDTDTAD